MPHGKLNVSGKNMTRLETVIAAARASLGTPFHHQGRASGIGLDCIGLVAHAYQSAGFDIADCLDYGREPEGGRLQAALLAHGFVRAENICEGDVLLFRFHGEPQHAAIALAPSLMIHAYAPVGKVVEAGMGETWLRRLVAIYRHPALRECE